MFRIYFIQLFRSVTDVGLLRFIILAGLIFLGGAFVVNKMDSYDYLFLLISLLAVTQIHLKRKDLHFLQIVSKQYILTVFLGYVLGFLPLLIVYVFFGKWLLICISVLYVLAISYYKHAPNKRNANNFLVKLVPCIHFEVRAGLRQYGFLMFAVWLLGLIFSFFIGAVPVAVLLLGILSLSFFEKHESLPMVIALEKNSETFILEKFKTIVFLYTLVSLPLIALYLIFNPLYWYIPFIVLIIIYSLQFYFICTKYSIIFKSGSSANNLMGSIGIMFAIIPIFLPVLWLLSLRSYGQAIKNLNFYLHDFR